MARDKKIDIAKVTPGDDELHLIFPNGDIIRVWYSGSDRVHKLYICTFNNTPLHISHGSENGSKGENILNGKVNSVYLSLGSLQYDEGEKV